MVPSTTSTPSERREDGGGRPGPAAVRLALSAGAESVHWPLVFLVEDRVPFLAIVVDQSPGGDYLLLQYVVLCVDFSAVTAAGIFA